MPSELCMSWQTVAPDGSRSESESQVWQLPQQTAEQAMNLTLERLSNKAGTLGALATFERHDARTFEVTAPLPEGGSVETLYTFRDV